MQAGHWAGPAVQPGQSSCAGHGLRGSADAAGGPGEELGWTAGAWEVMQAEVPAFPHSELLLG